MEKKLGLLVFICYLQVKLCKGETKTIARNGFCIVHYNEEVAVKETYIHEYTEPELQLCSHGYRYYNCWRDVKRTQIKTKTVKHNRELSTILLIIPLIFERRDEVIDEETFTDIDYVWKKEYHRWRGWEWKQVPKFVTLTRYMPKSVARTKVECCAGYKNTTVHENVYNCEPICDPPCIEGHCTMPGNCTCFEGYEHQNSSKCVPSCKPDCINGICNSPGHCECIEGYDKVNSSYCEPHCSQNCNNGICYEPEKCLCNLGYKNNPDDHFKCDPICHVPCVNATCTSYKECTCWNGYRKIPTQMNACEPICELECLNGDCTAPDICTCHKGYSVNDSINICEPDCSNCYNGFCYKPNECNCYENYTYNGKDKCEPICNNCTNGICIAPFECDCIEGYQMDDEGKCIPFCDSCDNGECVKPNVCSCFEGYESSFGSCFPLCEYGCFAGECIAPNNCSCQEFDRVEDNVCFPLQHNSTYLSENITPKRFQMDITKMPKSKDIYEVNLSNIYLKMNCSYEIIYKTTRGNERNSSNLIECSNIKSALGLFALCIWNGFSTDIRDLYNEFLPSIIHELNETETEKNNTKLGMTILLPTDMLSENEHCYFCPSWKHFRTKMPSNFTIPLTPCVMKHFENPKMSFTWKGIGIIVSSVLVALLLLTTLGLVIFFRKNLRHDYFVHSERTDEITLSLNQED